MYQRNLKRFLILSTLPISLFITINAFAAQLSVPDVYQLIKVNGQAVSSNFFSSETLVDLKVGRNIVILKYSELFEDEDNDDHATIKSAPQIVLFTIVNNSFNKYSLISPQINDDEQARIYAQSPTIKIVFTDEASGKENEVKLLSKSLTEFEAEVAFQNMEQPDITSFIKSKDNKITDNAAAVNALEKLKLWWAQADEQQKKQFIDFTQQ